MTYASPVLVVMVPVVLVAWVIGITYEPIMLGLTGVLLLVFLAWRQKKVDWDTFMTVQRLREVIDANIAWLYAARIKATTVEEWAATVEGFYAMELLPHIDPALLRKTRNLYASTVAFYVQAAVARHSRRDRPKTAREERMPEF